MKTIPVSIRDEGILATILMPVTRPEHKMNSYEYFLKDNEEGILGYMQASLITVFFHWQSLSPQALSQPERKRNREKEEESRHNHERGIKIGQGRFIDVCRWQQISREDQRNGAAGTSPVHLMAPPCTSVFVVAIDAVVWSLS